MKHFYRSRRGVWFNLALFHRFHVERDRGCLKDQIFSVIGVMDISQDEEITYVLEDFIEGEENAQEILDNIMRSL